MLQDSKILNITTKALPHKKNATETPDDTSSITVSYLSLHIIRSISFKSKLAPVKMFFILPGLTRRPGRQFLPHVGQSSLEPSTRERPWKTHAGRGAKLLTWNIRTSDFRCLLWLQTPQWYPMISGPFCPLFRLEILCNFWGAPTLLLQDFGGLWPECGGHYGGGAAQGEPKCGRMVCCSAFLPRPCLSERLYLLWMWCTAHPGQYDMIIHKPHVWWFIFHFCWVCLSGHFYIYLYIRNIYIYIWDGLNIVTIW